MMIDAQHETRDGISYAVSDDKLHLVVTDARSPDVRSGSFRLFTSFTSALALKQCDASIDISLPVDSGPRMIGRPMSEPNTLSLPSGAGQERITAIFPEVNVLEISISQPPAGMTFDPQSQTPIPEYFSNTECRWISGSAECKRTHSSISSRLIHGNARERLQMDRIRDGIGIGIWTAVFVTVFIDLVWTAVGFVEKLCASM